MEKKKSRTTQGQLTYRNAYEGRGWTPCEGGKRAKRYVQGREHQKTIEYVDLQKMKGETTRTQESPDRSQTNLVEGKEGKKKTIPTPTRSVNRKTVLLLDKSTSYQKTKKGLRSSAAGRVTRTTPRNRKKGKRGNRRQQTEARNKEGNDLHSPASSSTPLEGC